MRLLAHQIADRLGVLDVDDVLALPMPKILDWVEFYAAEHSGGTTTGTGRVKLTDPEVLRKQFEARYGG